MNRCETIADRIRYARAVRGISAYRLSLMAGRSVGYVKQLERDNMDPSSKTAGRIADALHVRLEWLIQGRGDSGLTERPPQSEPPSVPAA